MSPVCELAGPQRSLCSRSGVSAIGSSSRPLCRSPSTVPHPIRDLPRAGPPSEPRLRARCRARRLPDGARVYPWPVSRRAACPAALLVAPCPATARIPTKPGAPHDRGSTWDEQCGARQSWVGYDHRRGRQGPCWTMQMAGTASRYTLRIE